MISAEVIADSVNAEGNRLTTFKLRYPRFIHAEFMTHRMLSRNASSSRAVPFQHLVSEAMDRDKMAKPAVWGSERKGMQVGFPLDPEASKAAETLWQLAGEKAVGAVAALATLGVHKSILNRLLEPFTHINVIASGTEWTNFFGLRLDAAAEPTMRFLAHTMWCEMTSSDPDELRPDDWHLPFVDAETMTEIGRRETVQSVATDKMIKVSVARCARVSYQSFETGKRSTVEEDLALYDKLLGAQPLHASPAEHQATPDRKLSDGASMVGWARPDLHGNFKGWIQYRKTLKDESVAPLPVNYR